MRISPRDKKRLLYHVALAILSLLVLYLTRLYVPLANWLYVLTVGFGYWSLILIVATLLIGPVFLFIHRRNPLSLDVRRDMGIWAGITGSIHVLAALFQDERRGLIDYFFTWVDGVYLPRLDEFGIANYIGLIATIVILLLLFTSNDVALKRLKGKRWKALQRLNYLLIAFVLIHTFLYQNISGRETPFFYLAFGSFAVLMIVQGIGMIRHHENRWAHRHRDH